MHQGVAVAGCDAGGVATRLISLPRESEFRYTLVYEGT